jgi:hypothetical protein
MKIIMYGFALQKLKDAGIHTIQGLQMMPKRVQHKPFLHEQQHHISKILTCCHLSEHWCNWNLLHLNISIAITSEHQRYFAEQGGEPCSLLLS